MSIFKTEDNDFVLDNTNITYRKVPPSQMRRDSKRASAWNTKQIDDELLEKSETVNIDTIEKAINVEEKVSTTEHAFNHAATQDQATETDHVSSAEPSPLPNQVDGAYDSKVPEVVQTPSNVESASQQYCRARDLQASSSYHKQYHSPNTGTQLKHFRYRDMKIKTQCVSCRNGYGNVMDKSYFCTRCPGLICVQCVHNSHHQHHRNNLCGPANLADIAIGHM